MIDQKQLTEWAKLAKNERVPDLEHRDLGRTAVPALIAEVERLRRLEAENARWRKAVMGAGVVVCDDGSLVMTEEIADYERTRL